MGVLSDGATTGPTPPATANVGFRRGGDQLNGRTLRDVLIYTADSDTLSRRGSIWIAVRHAIDGWTLTGMGVSKWAALQNIGQSPQHFSTPPMRSSCSPVERSQSRCSGCGGIRCFEVRALDDRPRSGAALVVLVLIYSQTEVIWNPLAVDGLTWIYLLMTCGGLASVSRHAARPEGLHSDSRTRTITC